MAAGRRTAAAAGGGVGSGSNNAEGGAGEVKKRGNGGGAAAVPATPETRLTQPAPAAPTKRGSGSSSAAAAFEGSKPAAVSSSTPASSSSSSSSGLSFPSFFTLLFLALVAGVLYLSIPAIHELKQIVRTQGLSEKDVRKIVVETMESQNKEQARKRGASPKINKEDVRQAFRDLMKEEGAALLGPALQPAAPPAIDDIKLQKCVSTEVARQLRVYGPKGQPASAEERTAAAARGAVP